MPVIRAATIGPQAIREHQESSEIPLPLSPKYGGLGRSVNPDPGALLVGAGDVFMALPHPQEPNRVLVSGEECSVAWSRFGLELQAHVLLDQSLHRQAAPLFAGLRLGDEESHVKIVAQKGEKCFAATFGSDVVFNQDLSIESKVKFAFVEAPSMKTAILRMPTLGHPVEVGSHALANIKGIGLAFFDGENWNPVAGNLQGKGAAGRLAVFSNDSTLISATGISYTDKGLGLGVADPGATLHVRGDVILENGVVLGEIMPKAKHGTFGISEGKAGAWLNNTFKFFGSGEGNLVGSGKAGSLAVWVDGNELKSSTVGINAQGNLIAEGIHAKYLESHSVILDGKKLECDEEFLTFGGKRIGFHARSGAVSSDNLTVEGQGYVQGANLKISARLASHSELGIASFSEVFTVDKGKVGLDFSKMPHASGSVSGLLSHEDFKRFSEKAEYFAVGDVAGLDGIEVSGAGKAFGGAVVLKARRGTHEQAGMVALSERDFLFREGYAFLRNIPMSRREMEEMVDRKADKFLTQVIQTGRGFEKDYKLHMFAGPDTLNLATASHDVYGVAKFSQDFNVRDGVVSLNRGLASCENPGLMAPEHVLAIQKLHEVVGRMGVVFPMENGVIPYWDRGGFRGSKLTNTPTGVVADGVFAARKFLSQEGMLLGTTDAEASDTGAGHLRYERGALEVSDGHEWVRLKAGGLAGTGKPGALAYFSSEESVSSVSDLWWDEERSRLGWGVEAPQASLQVALPAAHFWIADTRPSSSQAGARLTLASDDGADLGAGDCLGSLEFGGKRGTGARVRALARSNWDGVSAPGTLALGTTPEGQLSPQDHVFLTPEGFLGLGLAKPTTPFEVALKNKKGISAQFAGAIKLGSSDESSSVVGGGALRYSQGRIEFSDGQQWRALALAE